MVSNFFKTNILPYVLDNKKEYNEKANDLLFVSLMIEKDTGQKPQSISDFYKSMLGAELFQYKLTDEESNILIECFKNEIIHSSEFSIVCISILSRLQRRDVNIFLLEQLKVHAQDDLIAKELIKAIQSTELYQSKANFNELLKGINFSGTIRAYIEQNFKD